VRKTILAGLFLTTVAVTCAHVGSLSASRDPFKRLSKQDRLAAIRVAQVWRPTTIASMEIRSGPEDEKGFAPNAVVACKYVDNKGSGRSPKFNCRTADGDEVKVKYGQTNGEVYGEVAASRLLWALGFGADHMYPVQVQCRDCPSDPARDSRERRPEVLFNPAAIERKMPGEEMESSPDSGWSWRELNLVDEESGGAPRAHRDAFKLLAASFSIPIPSRPSSV
jgi:hypothetical protein